MNRMIKVKILIIDDEEDFCEAIGNYLKTRGFEVLVAFNLEQGMELLKEKKPDILILDNNLPDGKGWEHTDQLLRDFPFLKINLISAFNEITSSYRSFPNVRVWEKPLSMRKLEEVFSI